MLALNFEQSRQNEAGVWYQSGATTRENQQVAQEQPIDDQLLVQRYAPDDDEARNQRVNFNPYVSQDMQLLSSSEEQAQGQASAQHRLNYQSILKKLKK